MKSFKVYRSMQQKLIMYFFGIVIPIIIMSLQKPGSLIFIVYGIGFMVIAFYFISISFEQYTIENKKIFYRGLFFSKKEINVKQIRKIVYDAPSQEEATYFTALAPNGKRQFAFSTGFGAMVNIQQFIEYLKNNGVKVEKKM